MCINAETSLFALSIGTFINILILRQTKNPDYLILVGWHQFGLLMQLFDFLSWTDLKCGMQNKIATIGAMISNMLQPVVAILLLLTYTQVKNKNSELIVSLLLCMYVGIVFYKFYYKQDAAITCLKPSAKCKHLRYDWWEVISKSSLTVFLIYLVPIVISFYLLLQSKTFAVIHLLYLIITCIISKIFYSCGVPSMFCLFAAGGPALNYLLMKYNV
jgi:hypothetical protein